MLGKELQQVKYYVLDALNHFRRYGFVNPRNAFIDFEKEKFGFTIGEGATEKVVQLALYELGHNNYLMTSFAFKIQKEKENAKTSEELEKLKENPFVQRFLELQK